VLFVRKTTCMLECLNRSMMYLDSLPEYVNVDHFRSLSVVGGRDGGRLGVGGDWERIVVEDLMDGV
jgi:hypothetical protein